MKEKGLIQVYTGGGKGKSTAAVGLAIRALGHGKRVCYVYFHKNPDKWGYGEFEILKQHGVDVFGFAKGHPHWDKDATLEKMRRECLKGVKFIKKIYDENRYDMLILDEIIISMRDGFLGEEEVLELMESKPSKLELILTGRGESDEKMRNLFKRADMVSKIENVKYWKEERREGIEY